MYAPVTAAVVVVTLTAAPRSSVPVSVIVIPAIPASPPCLIPSLFASLYTKPASDDGDSSPKLFPVPVVPDASTTALNTSLPDVPPGVPIVSVPSRKPAVAPSVIVYPAPLLGRRFANVYAPVTATLVVVTLTAAPRSSVPVSVIVIPAIPASPPCLIPSLFASLYTNPASDDGDSSPKLLPVPLVPEASTTALKTSLPAVPLGVPIVSVPSRKPAVAPSVIV